MTQPTSTAASPVWTGPALMVAGAICIGFAPIGLRLSEFGPQATAFWRFLFALPLIAVVIHARGGTLKKPHPLALLAGFFFGLDIAFWHLSLVKTSVANATFIVNLGNVAVGLIAWIALKQRPAKIWPLAVTIALVGAFMLSRGAANLTQGAIEGDLLAALAGLMVGLYLFLAMLARRDADGMNVLFWSTATTLAVSLGAALIARESLVPLEPSWLVMPLLLAIIAHVAGQGLIVAGVGGTPAALAGILLLLQPVTGAAIAWPLFGEALTSIQLAGAALVLAGVWLAGRRR